MFVIQRTTDGAFVADMRLNPSGSSYTHKLQFARTFPTREQADADRCPENERVLDVFHVLARPRL